MRQLNMTKLAKATFLAALGVVPVDLLYAQSSQTYRIPEPTGVPVQRHRNPKYDGRPFSADYQAAWQQYQQQRQQWMTLEQMKRSEPPSTRVARQAQVDYRNRQIAERMSKVRSDARPDYVVNHREYAKPSLFGQRNKSEAVVASRPRWTITQDLLSRVKPSEPEGVVTSVEVIAEYPVESKPKGFLARIFSRNQPEAEYVIHHPVIPGDEPTLVSDEATAEEEIYSHDVMVDEQGVVLTPVPIEPAFEKSHTPTAIEVPGIPQEISPKPTRTATRPVDQPRASLTLPMPELPIEDAWVEPVEVTPAMIHTPAVARIQKINWTVSEADFLDIKTEPVLPDLSVIPERVAKPAIMRPAPALNKVEPKEEKSYELPSIPVDVLKKYKAD